MNSALVRGLGTRSLLTFREKAFPKPSMTFLALTDGISILKILNALRVAFIVDDDKSSVEEEDTSKPSDYTRNPTRRR